jgi:hypothetical protein
MAQKWENQQNKPVVMVCLDKLSMKDTGNRPCYPAPKAINAEEIVNQTDRMTRLKERGWDSYECYDSCAVESQLK